MMMNTIVLEIIFNQIYCHRKLRNTNGTKQNLNMNEMNVV